MSQGAITLDAAEAQLAFGALQELRLRAADTPGDSPPLTEAEEALRQRLERARCSCGGYYELREGYIIVATRPGCPEHDPAAERAVTGEPCDRDGNPLTTNKEIPTHEEEA
jgi:hypothetical protein